ncbi:transcription termination factor [Mycoplasmopsis maculosa]|uniref:Transcription termination factor n=2 Tax=Mycoplasmopsis maculosa TaxID=114885 RepID=A0A449B3J5_9BACT|nr:transcription termination factor [Mycoplasmopsis maculosa]
MRDFRIEIINAIYYFELIETKLDTKYIFENYSNLNNNQFLQIEKIAKNYAFLKTSISTFLREDWSWNRISPLIRAILINAANELFTIQPRIVINEAVEITKLYYGDDNNFYKMVNAILNNVYKLFVKGEKILSEKK